MLSIAFGGYGCFKVSCQIDEKIRVSQKLTLICAGNKRFPTDRRYQEGWERERGEFPPTGGVHTHRVSRRVGKGVPTHGGMFTHGGSSHTGYQEGWEREFTHTGGVHTHGVSRRVGKGFPTHGGSSHTGGVHTHRVSRRVGKGVPTHGGEFTPTGYQEGWEREFHTHGVSRRVGKGVHTHGGMSLTGDVV